MSKGKEGNFVFHSTYKEFFNMHKRMNIGQSLFLMKQGKFNYNKKEKVMENTFDNHMSKCLASQSFKIKIADQLFEIENKDSIHYFLHFNRK